MSDNKKLAEMIELHLELKAKNGEREQRPEIVPEVPEAEGLLPPRSMLFPSNKKRITKIFYNALFLLFVILVIGLIYWGVRMGE